MNHNQCIAQARTLLTAMERLANDSPVGLWDDESAQLEDLISSMNATYRDRMDALSDAQPSDYDQHNTLNHRTQGTGRSA